MINDILDNMMLIFYCLSVSVCEYFPAVSLIVVLIILCLIVPSSRLDR